jgi:hypothetical protein
MSDKDLKTIWIITDETQSASTRDGVRDRSQDSGGLFGQPSPYTPPADFSGRKRVPVSAEKLKQKMAEFVAVMGDVLTYAQQQQSEMQLDEIELSVEVSSEGEVSLFGTGGKVGGKGAMVLKFKRKESNKDG